jgi:predicted TIM-barrel enzyme
VIAGVFAADPTREMAHFLRELIDLGFSGVINFPSIAWAEGELRAGLEASGLGFQREVYMIRLAGEAGLFTLAYVFTPDEAIAIIGVVDNGLSIMGVGPAYQAIAKGAIIIAAVGLDSLRRSSRQ